MYIKCWLEALRNDKLLIFSAASLAHKATEFPILAGQAEEADTPTHPTEEAASTFLPPYAAPR